MTLPYLSDYRVLVVPGLHGSGPDHWQSRWERLYPSLQRVEQDDWSQPDLTRWAQRMTEVLSESDQPTPVSYTHLTLPTNREV